MKDDERDTRSVSQAGPGMSGEPTSPEAATANGVRRDGARRERLRDALDRVSKPSPTPGPQAPGCGPTTSSAPQTGAGPPSTGESESFAEGTERDPSRCLSCGHANPLKASLCEKCGNDLVLTLLQEQQAPGPTQSFLIWEALFEGPLFWAIAGGLILYGLLGVVTSFASVSPGQQSGAIESNPMGVRMVIHSLVALAILGLGKLFHDRG